MVHDPLPVKASDVASPVTGAVLANRQREERQQSKGEKKRPRAAPPPTATAPPPRTDDEGDLHEIDVLA